MQSRFKEREMKEGETFSLKEREVRSSAKKP
jgi:hypothetical protein